MTVVFDSSMNSLFSRLLKCVTQINTSYDSVNLCFVHWCEWIDCPKIDTYLVRDVCLECCLLSYKRGICGADLEQYLLFLLTDEFYRVMIKSFTSLCHVCTNISFQYYFSSCDELVTLCVDHQIIKTLILYSLMHVCY